MSQFNSSESKKYETNGVCNNLIAHFVDTSGPKCLSWTSPSVCLPASSQRRRNNNCRPYRTDLLSSALYIRMYSRYSTSSRYTREPLTQKLARCTTGQPTRLFKPHRHLVAFNTVLVVFSPWSLVVVQRKDQYSSEAVRVNSHTF
jgi:hypothetical protein